MAVLERTGTWRDYADGSSVDHFTWWCQEHCVQSIDRFAGTPLLLEGWQQDYMSEVLAVDGAGAPYWLSTFLIVPRKNGKSSMLAALAAYHAAEDDGQPEILLCASSDKQAGRLFTYTASFIRRSDYLRSLFHLREYRGEISRVDAGALIQRMASDPDAAHGANPSLVLVDELHAFRRPSLRRYWSAVTTAGGAREVTRVSGITTEGEAHDRAESILGMLVDSNERDGDVERPHPGLTISRNHAARVLVYRYSAPTKDRRDRAAVRAANPASWVTDEYLERQALNPELADAEFMQLHACVAVDSRESFIGVDAWANLSDPEVQLTDGDVIYVGVDVGIVHDSTAVSWARVLPDGRIGVGCRVFAAKRDAAAHVHVDDDRVSLEEIEEFIETLARSYHLQELVYDPRFFEGSAQRLARAGLRVAPFEQSSKLMADAYQAFHDAVAERTIAHDGDRVLAAHVAAASAVKTERGWKVSKLRSQRIDALVACVMAHARAVQAGHRKTSPYMHRGLRST